MKMYVTCRFRDPVAKIEALCQAVKEAGYDDFCFVRDIEGYNPNHFSSPQEVWTAAADELRQCDALLIDATDGPSRWTYC